MKVRRLSRPALALAFITATAACSSSGGVKPPPPAHPGRTARVGVVVGTNSESFRRLLSVRDTQGVIVLYVQPGGPAERAGISVGDVIRSVDRYETQNAEVAVVQLRSLPDAVRKIALVRRNGDRSTVEVRARTPGAVDLRALYGPLIAQRPRDPLLRYLRAQADSSIDRFNEAITDLNEALRVDGRFADALVLRAERQWNRSEQSDLSAEQRRNLVRRALRDWAAALRIDNRNVRGISSLSQAIAISQPGPAMRGARKAIEMDKRLPSAYYALGLAALASKNREEAARAGRTAIDLDPFDARYYELLASAFRRLDRKDDCTRTLQALFTLFDDAREKARLLRICA